jgi:hypothetical protein
MEKFSCKYSIEDPSSVLPLQLPKILAARIAHLKIQAELALALLEKICKMGPLWKIIAESVGTDAKFKFAAPEDTVALWFLGESLS